MLKMKTLKNRLKTGVVGLGLVGSLMGCAPVYDTMPRWAQPGEHRDAQEMKTFKEKQRYLNSLQKLNYQNGDTWTNKRGLVFTRVDEDTWIFKKDGTNYSVRDLQIMGFVENTGILVDTSNRKFHLINRYDLEISEVRGGELVKLRDGSWGLITRTGNTKSGLGITDENIEEFIPRYDLEIKKK